MKIEHLNSQSREELISTVRRMRDRRNGIKVYFVISLALFLSILMGMGFIINSLRHDVEMAKEKSFEMAYHTDPHFNEVAFDKINDYRKEKGLEPVGEYQQQEGNIMIAALYGCALYTGQGWDINSCKNFNNQSNYTVSQYKVKSNPTPKTGESNVPTVNQFMTEFIKTYESDPKTVDVMSPNAKTAMIYVVGNGKQEWNVIVFTFTK